ncbi:hypothetical protein [Streptomyces sp. XD-27]|uniref:hypothetical protein n=1 Tax=Streptomyces sp. XD-27 TaxID=3062779 RepID=UPI0026F43D4B|nr:hypothetical protein [Streptomyces sp. XD-27]WKX70062.1 hypothetical protein Q3Y56_09185 [Streptomyces sp. XD-27]
MPDPILTIVTVTGDTVRTGDVIAIGGIPHRVATMLDVPGSRKRLQFEDGNAYVMPRSAVIDVARVCVTPRSRFRQTAITR